MSFTKDNNLNELQIDQGLSHASFTFLEVTISEHWYSKVFNLFCYSYFRVYS